MFQDFFLLHFLFNVLRLIFILFGSMFQDFSSLSHIKNSLHLYSPFSLLLLYIHMLTAFNACLQPSSGTYITPTLQYYLYLAHISRLWPRNGACIFYSVMVAYVLMLKLDVVDFVNVVIRFESLSVWDFGLGKL